MCAVIGCQLACLRVGVAGRRRPAARRLGVRPARAVVVEDSEAGVTAARAGGFGLVIGVDRSGEAGSELSARGEAVRAQVEQLMIAFQFQDRVHQIMDQVTASIASGVDRMCQALVSGQAPTADEWQALLSAGYTTDEQRAIHTGGAPAAASAQSTSDTTFF